MKQGIHIVKSFRNVKIEGKWHNEIFKKMQGFKVIAIQISDGRWFPIETVAVRS